MAVSEATLELVFRAQNLADKAIQDLKGGLSSAADSAKGAASKIAGAFAGLGGALSNAIGNATETLASGGSLTEALTGVGIYMAGQLTETFAGTFIEKIASSGLIAALTAPLAGLGTAAGGLIAAAIPVGMAALPVILVGALVAAVAVLIASPEIREKVFSFAGSVVSGIVDTISRLLPQLVGIVVGIFGTVWGAVVDGVSKFVGFVVNLWLALPRMLIGLGGDILRTIIGGLAELPGKVADIVRNAFASLKIDIGPFHITGSGVTVDLPKIDLPHFAQGVRGFTGGWAVVGEQGPELLRLPTGSDVIPHHETGALGGQGAVGSSFSIVGVTRDELARIADEGLYVRLIRAGAGLTG